MYKDLENFRENNSNRCEFFLNLILFFKVYNFNHFPFSLTVCKTGRGSGANPIPHEPAPKAVK